MVAAEPHTYPQPYHHSLPEMAIRGLLGLGEPGHEVLRRLNAEGAIEDPRTRGLIASAVARLDRRPD